MLDIKGAFDPALPGRLVKRLREQALPRNLLRWIESFVTDRTVKLRLGSETGPTQNITCRLPQGSPILPIFFMLYISPVFRIGKQLMKFGFVDGVTILATQKR